jgi:type I restriction enzyme S subunit
MLLNSPAIIFAIEGLKTGINDSGVNLTQDRFMELKVAVPSIVLQKRTLQELEGVLSNIDNLCQQVDTALDSADALRQSILKKAFSGQLVSQNPKDEPASVLLGRIRAEKAVPKSKGKRNAA